jgi:hypothetical protein
MARMLAGYERALLECAPAPAMPPARPEEALTRDTRLRIPPWCAVLDSGYYSDYLGYSSDQTLLGCLAQLADGVRVGELPVGGKLRLRDVYRWLGDGLVVSDPVVAGLGSNDPAIAHQPPERGLPEGAGLPLEHHTLL